MMPETKSALGFVYKFDKDPTCAVSENLMAENAGLTDSLEASDNTLSAVKGQLESAMATVNAQDTLIKTQSETVETYQTVLASYDPANGTVSLSDGLGELASKTGDNVIWLALIVLVALVIFILAAAYFARQYAPVPANHRRPRNHKTTVVETQ
jgi:hypothetical protein